MVWSKFPLHPKSIKVLPGEWAPHWPQLSKELIKFIWKLSTLVEKKKKKKKKHSLIFNVLLLISSLARKKVGRETRGSSLRTEKPFQLFWAVKKRYPSVLLLWNFIKNGAGWGKKKKKKAQTHNPEVFSGHPSSLQVSSDLISPLQ